MNNKEVHMVTGIVAFCQGF